MLRHARCVDIVWTERYIRAMPRPSPQRGERRIKTAAAVRSDARRRGVTINLRASAYVRDLIDRAAALLGQNRTDFMLDSPRRRAEDVLLDQSLFVLDKQRYEEFLNILNEPSKPTEELRKLFSTKSPWEK